MAANSEKDTQQAEKFKLEANSAYGKKEYDESIRLYTLAIGCDKDNAILYGNRAAAYIMKKQFTLALEDCEKAIKLDPNYTRGYLRAGKCFTELGRFFESKRAYDKSIELDPGNSVARKELEDVATIIKLIDVAKEKIESKNFGDAVRYLEKAGTLTSHSKVQILKAECLLGLKQYEKAASMMTTIIQQENTNVEALTIRGEALYRIGNSSQAIAHLAKAAAFDPDYSKAISLLRLVRATEKVKTLGNEAFKNGNYDEALQHYTSGLELDPRNDTYNATLYCNKAAANMKLSKYEEAIADCTAAIERDENYIRAYKRRATCYTQLEKHDEAVRDLDRALQLDENDDETKQDLSRAKKAQKIAKRKDYYKILNLPHKNPSESELKSAYKKSALKWHPDRHSSGTEEQRAEAEAKFKEVSEAFNVLSNPQQKRRYDNGESLEEMQSGGHPFHDGAGMEHIFAQMFGGMGGMGGMGGHGGHGGMPGGFSFRTSRGGGGFPF